MKKIIFSLLPFLIITLFFSCKKNNPTYTEPTPVPTAAPQWTTVGSSVSTGAAKWCRIDGNGTDIYVIYVDEANSDVATVKKLNGSTWVDVAGGTISAGTSDRTTMLVDGSNVIAAYLDTSSAPQKPTVRVYNGSGWSTVGADRFTTNSSTIWQEALCADNGNIYLATLDDTSTATKIYEFSSSSWTQFGSDVYGGLSWYANIEFYNNIPYVMYEDSSYYARVKNMPVSTWSTFGTGTVSAGTSSQYAMEITSGGVVYIAYGDWTISKKLRVKKSNSGAWGDVGTSTGISFGEPRYASMKLDNNENVYVAYSDGGASNKLYVKKFDGSSWSDYGTNPVSSSDTSYQSLYIHNGVPYVAFVDAANGNKVIVMKYE